MGSSRIAEPSNWKESRVEDERSYAVVDFLYHPALSTMQSSAFFNLCRLHAIAFDLHGRVGTLFNLVDSMARGVLSIITIGRDQKGSLQTLLRTLQFMHEQVGVQNVQSEFNDSIGNFSLVLSTAKALCKKYNGEKPFRPDHVSSFHCCRVFKLPIIDTCTTCCL
jgi:hypothetical protein